MKVFMNKDNVCFEVIQTQDFTCKDCCFFKKHKCNASIDIQEFCNEQLCDSDNIIFKEIVTKKQNFMEKWYEKRI